MKNLFQTTLLEPVEFKGIGLHSGKKSLIRILPADANQGVIFKRVDINNINNVVVANFKNVSSTKLCTTLENNEGIKVSTVEHLLAALYFSEIDNVVVEINTEEVPIMDGSAKEFLKILKNSKIKFLPVKRKFLKVLNKVEFEKGEKNSQ